MKKQLSLALAGLALVAGCGTTSPDASSISAPTASASRLDEFNIGPMMGVQSERGAAMSGAGTLYGNMTLHGGKVMPSSVTYAIFWGPDWNTNSTFTADKITGIPSLLAGFNNSNYAHTVTEYNGVDGVYAGTGTQFMASYVDNSAAPRRAPQVSGVQNEVCSVLAANGVTPRSDAIYNVYATTKRGSAGYCAWHSYGSCNGVPVQFAWYFNLDGDAGCDPQSPASAGHSQGLSAIANVTAHEVYETISDPRNGGWYDSNNGENADKCAWAFSPNNGTLVPLSNGTSWKLQMEWSNREYTAGTGYANRDGQKACLDGVVKY